MSKVFRIPDLSSEDCHMAFGAPTSDASIEPLRRAQQTLRSAAHMSGCNANGNEPCLLRGVGLRSAP